MPLAIVALYSLNKYPEQLIGISILDQDLVFHGQLRSAKKAKAVRWCGLWSLACQLLRICCDHNGRSTFVSHKECKMLFRRNIIGGGCEWRHVPLKSACIIVVTGHAEVGCGGEQVFMVASVDCKKARLLPPAIHIIQSFVSYRSREAHGCGTQLPSGVNVLARADNLIRLSQAHAWAMLILRE